MMEAARRRTHNDSAFEARLHGLEIKGSSSQVESEMALSEEDDERASRAMAEAVKRKMLEQAREAHCQTTN